MSEPDATELGDRRLHNQSGDLGLQPEPVNELEPVSVPDLLNRLNSIVTNDLGSLIGVSSLAETIRAVAAAARIQADRAEIERLRETIAAVVTSEQAAARADTAQPAASAPPERWEITTEAVNPETIAVGTGNRLWSVDRPLGVSADVHGKSWVWYCRRVG